MCREGRENQPAAALGAQQLRWRAASDVAGVLPRKDADPEWQPGGGQCVGHGWPGATHNGTVRPAVAIDMQDAVSDCGFAAAIITAASSFRSTRRRVTLQMCQRNGKATLANADLCRTECTKPLCTGTLPKPGTNLLQRSRRCRARV